MEQWSKDILHFWFEELETPKDWFAGGARVDEQITLRFAELIEPVVTGLKSKSTSQTAEEALATCILLDQFPRSIFRGDAKAFAYDHIALRVAKNAVEKGLDLQLKAIQRNFIYLPFEHAEALSEQIESVHLIAQLEKEERGLLEWAIDHYQVIKRFGRFPHRNKALARESTEEEIKFLQTANTYGQ